MNAGMRKSCQQISEEIEKRFMGPDQLKKELKGNPFVLDPSKIGEKAAASADGTATTPATVTQ